MLCYTASESFTPSGSMFIQLPVLRRNRARMKFGDACCQQETMLLARERWIWEVWNKWPEKVIVVNLNLASRLTSKSAVWCFCCSWADINPSGRLCRPVDWLHYLRLLEKQVVWSPWRCLVSLTFLQWSSTGCKRQFGLCVSLMAADGFGIEKLAVCEFFPPWAHPFPLQISSPVNTAGSHDDWDEPFGSPRSPLRNSTQPDTAWPAAAAVPAAAAATAAADAEGEWLLTGERRLEVAYQTLLTCQQLCALPLCAQKDVSSAGDGL